MINVIFNSFFVFRKFYIMIYFFGFKKSNKSLKLEKMQKLSVSHIKILLLKTLSL